MCVKLIATENLVNALENSIDIPEGNHIVMVFKNNDSEDIEGFACVSEEDSGEYPIMSLEELISKYGFKKDKYFESPEHATIPIEIQEMSETFGNYESCDKDVENMEINAKFAMETYPYPKHRIDLGIGVYEIGPGVFCGKKGLDDFNKAILESLR